MTISQTEALQQLQEMREYQQLKQLIGNHINEVVESFDGFMQQSLHRGIYHPTAPGLRIKVSQQYGKESDLDPYRDILKLERQALLKMRSEISEVWQLANDGRLHARLQQEHLAPEDYGASARDSDLEKSVKWAFSRGKDNPDATVAHRIRQTLRYAVLHLDLRDMATADYLHVNLVDQNSLPPYRRHHPGVGYCSTGGGRAMQDAMEVLSQGFAVKACSGANMWDDLACFLLGAHIRAQPYSDGNKRVARALYAAALLKGDRPFCVPNRNLEVTLMGAHFVK
ncbi:hypothetical protein ACJ5NV_05490 [Loktanella agnita]|uniref:hypothetical protein n=1 Tax=Loktanella agnita TaxID=287097 RepID=UPI0039868D5D